MDSNKNTPGGKNGSSLNPLPTGTEVTQILEVSKTILCVEEDDKFLSEVDRLLEGKDDGQVAKSSSKQTTSSVKVDKDEASKSGIDKLSSTSIEKRIATMTAIKAYKKKVNKAKFYLDKSRQSLKDGKPLSREFRDIDKRSQELLLNEERRRKEGISYSKFLNLSNSDCPSSKRNRSMDDDITPPPNKKGPASTALNPSQGAIRKDESSRSTPSSSRLVSEGRMRLSRTAESHNRPSISKSQPSIAPKFTNSKPRVTNLYESFRDISKQTLKVCIVDASSRDLRMSRQNFSKVEGIIQDAIVDKIMELKMTSFPTFHMKERFRGYPIINCENDFSLQFLKETVRNMNNKDLWDGANLEVRQLHELK